MKIQISRNAKTGKFIASVGNHLPVGTALTSHESTTFINTAMTTSNLTGLLPLCGTVLKSVPLSDHITIGFMSLLRIFGAITRCCHCNCALLCLQTPGRSIITTCELIHYHYFTMWLFHNNSVRGRNNLLQFICKYVTLSLFSYTVVLHNIHTHTHTNSNTAYTSSHSYRRTQRTLNHDTYILYMTSAAPPGKKFYKITVDLTDLKHEIQFLYSSNILILRIPTSNLH